MKTSAIAIGVALLILTVGVFTIFQDNQINQHKQILAEKDSEISELNNHLDEEIEKVSLLSQQNKIYKDSIVSLNLKIAELQLIIKEKDRQIKELNDKLKRRQVEYEDLKDKIAMLYRRDELNKKAIAKLEREKDKVKKEMSYITGKTKDLFSTRSSSQAEVYDYQSHITKMNLLTDIAENTTVRFKEVTGRKFKNGRKISKIRRNMNGWQYTDIKFTLSHPNHKALLNQSYVLKIFDLEREVPIAYIEQNPKFPHNNQKGLPFRFDGNTVELTYSNMQTKKSENFEVRVYFLFNGEEVALENGVLPLVKNGKFMNI